MKHKRAQRETKKNTNQKNQDSIKQDLKQGWEITSEIGSIKE